VGLGFLLLDVRLVDSKRFKPWRQQTGKSRPERSLAEIDWANIGQTYAIHRKTCLPHRRYGTSLSVFCRYDKIDWVRFGLYSPPSNLDPRASIRPNDHEIF